MARFTLINSSLLALALLASGPVAAEESPGARAAIVAANSVGRWIASQGNQALIQIRAELRRDLAESLKPLLPSPDSIAKPAPAAAPATAATH